MFNRKLQFAAASCLLAFCPNVNAVLFDWGSVGFIENQDPGTVQGTFIPSGPNNLSNPYLGLSGASGGVTGFQSQTFSNISGSGADLTVYYSRNNVDGNNSQGPDLYTGTENPDRHLSGENALRISRNTATPVSVILSFSQPVYLNEYISASLSDVSGSHENSFIRAFATADATGAVVKASYFENISDLTESSSLNIDSLTSSGNSPHVNELANVSTDNPLDSSGVFTGAGSANDSGIYHTAGVVLQRTNPAGYGRVLLRYEDVAVRSIAYTTWASADINFDEFEVSGTNISTVIAPFDFTVVPEPSQYALLVGVCCIALATARRRVATNS